MFLICLLEAAFEKIFKNPEICKKILKTTDILFSCISFWFLLVIVISWLPIDIKDSFLYPVVYPVAAICAPLGLFLPAGWEIASMILVIYLFKFHLGNFLNVEVEDDDNNEAE